MNAYRIRRATSDDLNMLLTLWKEAQLPALDLEKRFTEFQVVEAPQGALVAAIGLQIDGHFGWIHSETIPDFAMADTLRPLIWERFQNLAVNHGLYRFWTDETAPFWKKDAGFIEPNEEVRKKFPVAFGTCHDKCLTLWLRDEPAFLDDVEKQFELFRQAGQIERDKLARQATTLKAVQLGIAVLVFLMGVGALVYVLRHSAY